jgi:hypothetical protein
VPRRLAFEHSRLIIAEGEEDATVTRAVLAAYQQNITDCDVSPNIDIGGVGGNPGFYKSILTADAMPSFEPVRDVIFIADNDNQGLPSGRRVHR